MGGFLPVTKVMGRLNLVTTYSAASAVAGTGNDLILQWANNRLLASEAAAARRL